ncbi:hypothetical protein Clacol_007153 [Clathrus columnatus]|uniref:F-box domain-containing protein n=1 Tax=Clathrus columnatus TaxID=1419009 RepID=A0AAV5AGQ6_9AGAM|nr:hypothetical protein Clacol_007153 [Clathrus columnatus]
MPYPGRLPIHTLWDEITSLLDLTKDLLSLALTCHTFKELIIPHHLEYRYICCDPHRADVWKWFASRLHLSRRIRCVKLIYEPHGRVLLPQALIKIMDWTPSSNPLPWQPTVEALPLFRNALSQMISLKEFIWTHGRGWTSSDEFIETSRVLTNTTHCLEALSIKFDSVLWTDPKDRLRLEQLSVKFYMELVQFEKIGINYPCDALIHMILHLCPDIEDLQLTGPRFTTAKVSYIMQHANWKNLRRLYFYSYTPHHTPDLPANMILFLNKHTTLKSLYLELADSPLPNSLASCLPNLRSIGSGTHNSAFEPSTFLSNDIISRLVHWHCPIRNINIDTLPQMNNLKSACLQLYGVLPGAHVPFLLKAPNLKRIRLKGDFLDDYSETLQLRHAYLLRVFTGWRHPGRGSREIRLIIEEITHFTKFKLLFLDLLTFIRGFNPKTPILTLCFPGITATILKIGPEELGGRGDLATEGEFLAKETGMSINEINIELRDCDGVITTSTRIFEPESNEALKAYYEGSGRSYYVAGPLAITSIDQLSREQSPDRHAVETFLDWIFQTHGERSVIYMGPLRD